MTPIARLFVRRDGRLILGGAVPDAGLKPGTVYEIQAIPGDLILVEVGPSCVSHPDALELVGSTDHVSPDTLIARGNPHLMTVDEAKAGRS